MRVLIMNDDCHDNRYCFESGDRLELEEFLKVLAPAHNENYELRYAFFPDIYDQYLILNPEINEDDASSVLDRLFDNVMFRYNFVFEIYSKSFNEIWELAQMC